MKRPRNGLGLQATLSRCALAVAAGVLHGLCFPPVGAWPLAFVTLAPLVAAARDERARTGAGLGWLAGTVASSIATTPWITAATLHYFRQGRLGAVLFATLVGQLFHALPTALFGAAVPRLARLPAAPARVLAMAALWTALEFLRANVLTGAPWDLLAHALYTQPLWIQTADLGGTFAVSFVLAATGTAVAEALRGPPRAAVAAVATAAALLVMVAGYGALRLRAETDDGPALRVALVQGNVPNAWRGDPTHADDAFAAFATTTRAIVHAHPDLIVWPENAVSFLLAPNPRFGAAVAALLGPDGPPLLLGGPRFASPGTGRAQFFNSAYLLGPTAAVLAGYDKRRLVPFAEYAPVPRLPGLGWRFDAPGDYTPGGAATVFPTPAPFGVLLCFEAIYPDLAGDLARAGARFLVNLSNDAWFGTSAGLEQHFASGVFRAVETRRAMARATNTGVTALVGPSGRIMARFPVDVRDAWIVSVPLRSGKTPYTRYGDAFAWLATLGALAALAATRQRPPRGR